MKKQRKPGARRKLDDPARRKRLLQTLLRTGQRTKAVRAAGITFQCLDDSIERDEELRAAVEEIEKRAIASARDCVNGSVATDPLMALRFLERKLPEEYGRKGQHVHKHGHIHITIEQQRSTVSAAAAELGLSDVLEEDSESGTAAIGSSTVGGGGGLPAAAGVEATSDDADAASV